MTPTYIKDGYLFFKEPNRVDSILGDSLVINTENLTDIIRYARENGIKNIRIIPAYYRVTDLAFLKDMVFIEGLNVLQDDLDLAYVNSLKNLRLLRLNEVHTPLDFANFPELEVLGITYSKNTINIGNCKKLFWLWLENFKKDDVQELSGLGRLQYLTLHKTSIFDLTGLAKLSGLKELKIDTAGKLASLNGLSDANADLEVLDVYGARQLSDYKEIAKAKSLKKLFFSKTGDVSDLSFLKELPNLEHAIIGMKVLDGDMHYLKKIRGAGFVDHPHYNLKMKELKKA